MPGDQVVRVHDGLVLEFDNGMRFRLQLLSPSKQADGSAPAGRRGRKPSPATATLIQALTQDARQGTQQSRQAYLTILKEAGHKGSDASAHVIVAREAKRAFGHTLGRARKPPRRRTGKRGPQHRQDAQILRDRMAKDKADGGLRDAAYYLRWLMDQSGITVGLKGARPIVYRELRKAKLV